MPDALALVFLALHVLSWPIVKLANAVIILVSPIWALVAFLLLPFIHLARVFVNIASFPLKTQWLERIEVITVASPPTRLKPCRLSTSTSAQLP